MKEQKGRMDSGQNKMHLEVSGEELGVKIKGEKNPFHEEGN